MKLEEEIVQSKFRNAWEKAAVNIVYTSNWLHARHSGYLKPEGLTVPQYNILRILRGQHPRPATIGLLTERMLDKMSNASRLVEKLRHKGLAERRKCPSDRRQVHVVITDEGLAVLKRLDVRMLAEERVLRRITGTEANELNRILDKLRG